MSKTFPNLLYKHHCRHFCDTWQPFKAIPEISNTERPNRIPRFHASHFNIPTLTPGIFWNPEINSTALRFQYSNIRHLEFGSSYLNFKEFHASRFQYSTTRPLESWNTGILEYLKWLIYDASSLNASSTNLKCRSDWSISAPSFW